MRRMVRRRAQRTLNDGSNLIVVDRSRPPGSRLIRQAIDAALEKTAATRPSAGQTALNGTALRISFG